MLQIVEEQIVDSEGNTVTQYRVFKEEGDNIAIEWTFENNELAQAFFDEYDGDQLWVKTTV